MKCGKTVAYFTELWLCWARLLIRRIIKDSHQLDSRYNFLEIAFSRAAQSQLNPRNSHYWGIGGQLASRLPLNVSNGGKYCSVCAGHKAIIVNTFCSYSVIREFLWFWKTDMAWNTLCRGAELWEKPWKLVGKPLVRVKKESIWWRPHSECWGAF